MQKVFGIIGYPLSHSFSPAYFKKKFEAEHIDAVYNAFPLGNIEGFTVLIKNHNELNGLNVTIPYKESVIKYLDETDAIAKAIGAVNCITIKKGRIKGYNTDVIGFEKSLLPLLQPHHQHAFILGTGGASKAVAYVLNKLGISFQKVSREMTGALHYDDITPELIQHHTLIINTTPLGMYPNADAFPKLPYEAIGKQHLLYDLIYNPEETKFLSLSRAQGATIKNGFEMLEIQAEESWRIWNDEIAQ
jgi:shikimate dehydrogenase